MKYDEKSIILIVSLLGLFCVSSYALKPTISERYYPCQQEERKSVSSIELPAPEDWKQEWEAIDDIMKENGFSYPDEEADRKEIMELLADNKFIVHHSKRFNEAYHQHYRIVSKEIFSNEIYPLIDKAHLNKARR